MDESAEGGILGSLAKLFRTKSDSPVEDFLVAAKEDGKIGPEVAAMLLKVLRLEERQVADVMMPRSDIVCAEVDDTLEEVSALLIEHGHSRIPIYRGNRDTIVGVIYAKDLLSVMLSSLRAATTPSTIMRKPLFIPETKNLRQMLLEFQTKRTHIAIALDEYGGTSGMVTLEDVLEEIVGEIEDEHDAKRDDEPTSLEDGRLLVAGRTHLEELREKFNLPLFSEEVETLGGFLSLLAGRIPEAGERFDIQGRSYTVVEADNRQIKMIEISPEDTGSPADA